MITSGFNGNLSFQVHQWPLKRFILLQFPCSAATFTCGSFHKRSCHVWIKPYATSCKHCIYSIPHVQFSPKDTVKGQSSLWSGPPGNNYSNPLYAVINRLFSLYIQGKSQCLFFFRRCVEWGVAHWRLLWYVPQQATGSCCTYVLHVAL